jgi:hypothetical protein
MRNGIEPQAVTDAIHRTIGAVQRYTPRVVQRQALGAAAEIGAVMSPVFDPMGNAQNLDREAGS